jgi:hypothetical protein
MLRASTIVLVVVTSASCGGQSEAPMPVPAAPLPGASEESKVSPTPSTTAGTPTASDDRALGVPTCAQAGCQTAFRCTACDAELVCDDVHGAAACVTIETFFECGEGTRFCNSSCGVCLLPGSPCVKDSCDATVKPCGRGARCGSGTRCVDDVCVLDQ